ncbi:hypothetical protein FA13DRAFT_1343299 [Coprinellus micaceus]|uniref:DUF2423 domain-containing protein n=1 Tax=Coprinellus micaceus TaxID=71717 RepID=A0A4Y7TNF5_COPMI|nr:hypothetical protein FA13DRAFT_1343299 [Coprinellus micaceus]
MAKSLRSKTKRSFRAKKREEGVYAATHAARLQRLNSKLVETAKKDADGEETMEGDDEVADVPDDMAVDGGAEQPKRISTHGPRNSRRESWRASKGLAPKPALKAMNRQGGVAARRKAGRSHRRR